MQYGNILLIFNTVAVIFDFYQTYKGESELTDLPFLFFQDRIFRACDLTLDLKMRYGSDIYIIPEK
jgi:hypothetical protein